MQSETNIFPFLLFCFFSGFPHFPSPVCSRFPFSFSSVAASFSQFLFIYFFPRSRRLKNKEMVEEEKKENSRYQKQKKGSRSGFPPPVLKRRNGPRRTSLMYFFPLPLPHFFITPNFCIFIFAVRSFLVLRFVCFASVFYSFLLAFSP